MSWTNNQYEIRLEQMESDMDDLQTDLTKKDQRIKELEQDLKDCENSMNDMDLELRDCEDYMAEMDAENKRLLNTKYYLLCFIEDLINDS
jgi:septal ring factor EnvC (AmiA/AmiB activator)